MTVASTWIDDFIEWLTVEKGRSRATLEAYRRDIEQFSGWLRVQGATMEQVTTSVIDDYLASLRDQRAPSSVSRAASSLRGFFGFLVDERLLHEDPTQRVSAGRRGKTLPKPLEESRVLHLLDTLPDRSCVDRRDRALLELLYGTGARVSEVVGLSLGDVDFDEELLRVTGKGSKQRLVPMGRALKSALRTYLGPGGRSEFPQPRPTPRLFLNARGGPLTRQGIDLIIGRRALDAGLDRSTISAHVFRHSCATHMLNHGADIRVVQELLGHASIATTQLYTAVSVTSLQQAYSAAHPRAVG
jgi:integrase/recombinase XerD